MSDSGFSLGRNDMVNTSVPEKSSHRTLVILKHTPMSKAVLPSPKHTSAREAELMHEEERVTLVLVLTRAFGIWYAFR